MYDGFDCPIQKLCFLLEDKLLKLHSVCASYDIFKTNVLLNVLSDLIETEKVTDFIQNSNLNDNQK